MLSITLLFFLITNKTVNSIYSSLRFDKYSYLESQRIFVVDRFIVMTLSSVLIFSRTAVFEFQDRWKFSPHFFTNPPKLCVNPAPVSKIHFEISIGYLTISRIYEQLSKRSRNMTTQINTSKCIEHTKALISDTNLIPGVYLKVIVFYNPMITQSCLKNALAHKCRG